MTPEAPDPGSLRAIGIRGSLWTLGGHAASQVVRFASNLVLARLLFPAVFGQVALIYTFITALHLFSDLGTGPSIIQNRRGDDPAFLRTAWTVSVIRGFVLWAASWLVAIPAANFYGQPSLRWLIPVAAISAALGGFESTSISLARRHLRLERLTVLEIGSQVAGTVTTIALALLNRARFGPDDPGAVWAVVGGGLAIEVTRVVLSHVYLPGIRHRFELDRDALDSLFRFGRWILVSTVLTFLAGPADRLVFGKLVSLAMLGVYGIASNLAAIPTDAALKIGAAVVFPTFSRIVGRPDFRSVFPRVRMPLVLGGALLVSGLAAVGPFATAILYDARYRDAGWIVQILAAMSWFRILENTNGSLLLATGRSDWMAAGNGLKLAGMFAFIPGGFLILGFAGALWGLVLAEVLRYLVSAIAIRRTGLHVLARDATLTVGVVLVALAGYLAGSLTRNWSGSRVLAFLAAGIPPIIAWGVIGLRYWSKRSLDVFRAAAPQQERRVD